MSSLKRNSVSKVLHARQIDSRPQAPPLFLDVGREDVELVPRPCKGVREVDLHCATAMLDRRLLQLPLYELAGNVTQHIRLRWTGPNSIYCVAGVPEVSC